MERNIRLRLTVLATAASLLGYSARPIEAPLHGRETSLNTKAGAAHMGAAPSADRMEIVGSFGKLPLGGSRRPGAAAPAAILQRI